MLDDDALTGLAGRLVEVPGVVAVSLGGSRARGDHAPDSDVDLGLHYRPPLDTASLRALAREVAGTSADVTEPGGWGPWVDGGGWLEVNGTPVDWIYRDLDRVRASWDDAVAGRVAWHVQTGHPLGFPSFAYAGEAALGVVLADPTGELTALHDAARHHPPALSAAVVEHGLGEATFLLGGARKAVPRGDAAYLAGCLFRIVLLCAHALHAAAGRWVVNEKGAVAAAGRLDLAPAGFAERAHAVFGHGASPADLQRALDAAAELVTEVRHACGSTGRG